MTTPSGQTTTYIYDPTSGLLAERRNFMTTEHSVHYGENWTPEIRAHFSGVMRDRGLNFPEPEPWGS